MGFFKDFKNDMKQAVNELIPDNEEMVNEYDDEDMVNTLETGAQPEDEEYVNTMEEEPARPAAGEDDILDEVDLADLEEFDLDEEDIEDALSGQTTPEEFAKSVLDTIRTETTAPADKAEQDMDALAELLSESADKVEPEKSEAKPKKKPKASEEVPKTVKPEPKVEQQEKPKQEKPKAEQKAPEEEKEVTDQKEEAVMAEDKIIEITTVKEAEAAPKAAMPAEAPDPEAVDSTTYITKGTRIEGNLYTDGSIDIIGTVDGDVNCYGKLVISGIVNGKVNASEIYANAAKINGEIVSSGSVKIGVGSVIVGNIEAQSAVVAGAVNGDLDVKGPVIVDSTAVIVGNIKSRSVQINNGAVIEGFCSQCYSDVDVKSFFA